MWIILQAAIRPHLETINRLDDGDARDLEIVRMIRVLARYRGDYDLDDMAPSFILTSDRCKEFRNTAFQLINEHQGVN